MESHTDYGMHSVPMFDADPFRNGTDCCCAVHTCAGRYKRSMNAIRDEGTDVQPLLDAMEENYKGVLAAGCRMAEVWARIYVLELIS